jgi:uncharacterized protein (DUF305 family)
MNRTCCRILTVALTVIALRTAGAQDTPASGPSPSDSIHHPYTAATIYFMTGMIHHHAQAVLMAGWAPNHDAGPAVRNLCERIVVGQRDEIGTMQRWLRERNQPVPDADPMTDMMPGMAGSMMMPGMLTPDQLKQLDAARGSDFDRLFLTFMIQHHRGALTMVDQLFSSQGGAADDMIFKFASDMSADQTIEIERMTNMLGAPAAGTPSQ